MSAVSVISNESRLEPTRREAFVQLWRSYHQDWRASLGLFLVVSAILVAIIGPLFTPHDHRVMSGAVLQPPSSEYWMGTDHLGRDVLSRIVFGARISLMFAIGAALISLAIGVVLGAVAGYFGGIVDQVLSRMFEFFLMLPVLFLVILMAALFGANIYVAAVVIGASIWPANARITRAQVLSFKSRAFVRSARASGVGHISILFKHILPNGMQPVIVNSTLQVGSAILLEASLSFLGLGDPNFPSWGQMLREGQSYISFHGWYAFFPGVAIGWLVLGFTLFGDGVNRLLNRSA